MLSYQHSYHAGSFADVVKHLTLTRLLQYLTQKDKPSFYLETHAGRGLYDLTDQHALKTKEFQQGISLLWRARAKAPSLLEPYLSLIADYNHGAGLKFYPGSPAVALNMMRQQDRLFCAEMHPQEFNALQQIGRQGKQITYQQIDGLTALKAQLPPAEKRGLVFIDPSYELPAEYKTIPAAVKAAYERFATGVCCIWYPILVGDRHPSFHTALRAIDLKSTLQVEFYACNEENRHANQRMIGCGLFIINPPYTLAAELDEMLAFLCTVINPGQSSYKLFS